VKRHAPAATRNREPIAAVLTEELPTTGLVLEIASGTGEHAVHFARTYPSVTWQPSDPDAAARESITAWREESGLPNLLPPLDLDAAAPAWPLARADAVVCINMTHISPPAATEGLFRGAHGLLGPGTPLVLYGPFLEEGIEPAPSNVAFDRDLRERDAAWGLRRTSWLDLLADACGFSRTRRVAMPANNLTLIYRRRG
jgi:hypothetical protein